MQGGAAEITNASTGKIDASYNGIFASKSAPLTLNNAGVIESLRGPTVEMLGGGTVVNTGVIQNIASLARPTSQFCCRALAELRTRELSRPRTGFSQSISEAPSSTLSRSTRGSQITGNVRGGTGVDNLILQGTGVETLARFSAFENLAMNGVDWRLAGAARSAEEQKSQPESFC